MEAGKELALGLQGTVNLFYQETRNIIQFTNDIPNDDTYYVNAGKIGTYGMESEVKYSHHRYVGLINVSYFAPNLYNDPGNSLSSSPNPKGGDAVLATQQPNKLLAVPPVKIYTNHSYDLTRDISIQANALFLASRPAEDFVFSPTVMDEVEGTKTLRAQVIFGLGMLFNNVIGNLSLDLSVHDLFNQGINMAVPYKGQRTQDVFPYKGREVSLGATYKF